MAVGKLGAYGHPVPRADTRCFPILHSALVLLSSSRQAWTMGTRKALQPQGCFLGTAFAAPPTPHPLHAGLSAAGAILHLLSASLLPRGQVWARAKHQLRHALLPQTCHGTADRTQSSPATAKSLSLCSYSTHTICRYAGLEMRSFDLAKPLGNRTIIC